MRSAASFVEGTLREHQPGHERPDARVLAHESEQEHHPDRRREEPRADEPALLAPDVNYIGIDTTDAKEHFGYEMPNTRYFMGDVWPLDDASGDLLLATETLEHVPDPARFLTEAYRCLKTRGQILLTVPFAARWHFIPHDYWRYTPSCLRRLLEAAGFADVQVYARGNALTVACYKVMALILPLLMPQQRRGLIAIASRLAGFACLPLLALLAAVGTLSLRGSGGNDCLGYTVVALKRG